MTDQETKPSSSDPGSELPPVTYFVLDVSGREDYLKEWWENGGEDLWSSYQDRDGQSSPDVPLVLPEYLVASFFAAAREIKGWQPQGEELLVYDMTANPDDVVQRSSQQRVIAMSAYVTRYVITGLRKHLAPDVGVGSKPDGYAHVDLARETRNLFNTTLKELDSAMHGVNILYQSTDRIMEFGLSYVNTGGPPRDWDADLVAQVASLAPGRAAERLDAARRLREQAADLFRTVRELRHLFPGYLTPGKQ